MIVERIDELADSVLDGEASAEERAELERLLAEHPEARARVAERKELFAALRRVPRHAPPADLRESIMAEIETVGAPVHGPGHGRGNRSLLARHPVLALSYAVIAGVAIGSIVTLTLVGPSRKTRPDAPIAGTMAPVRSGIERETIARGRLELPGAELKAGVQPGARVVIEGRSTAPIELDIAFEPGDLRLESIFLPPASADLAVEQSKGVVRVSGSGDITLELGWLPMVPEPRPLTIRGRLEGKEETIEPGREPHGPRFSTRTLRFVSHEGSLGRWFGALFTTQPQGGNIHGKQEDHHHGRGPRRGGLRVRGDAQPDVREEGHGRHHRRRGPLPVGTDRQSGREPRQSAGRHVPPERRVPQARLQPEVSRGRQERELQQDRVHGPARGERQERPRSDPGQLVGEDAARRPGLHDRGHERSAAPRDASGAAAVRRQAILEAGPAAQVSGSQGTGQGGGVHHGRRCVQHPDGRAARHRQQQSDRRQPGARGVQQDPRGHSSLQASDALKDLEANHQLPEALSQGFMELFSTADMAAFATEGLAAIVDNQAFTDALHIEGFQQLAEALNGQNIEAVRDIANSPEMLQVLSDGSYREAAMHAELGAVATAGLEAAVQKVGE